MKYVGFQSDDPAVKWQLNLYKDILKSDGPTDPEKNVERVQRISAALYHLEQVKSQMSILCLFLKNRDFSWQRLFQVQ